MNGCDDENPAAHYDTEQLGKAVEEMKPVQAPLSGSLF